MNGGLQYCNHHDQEQEPDQLMYPRQDQVTSQRGKWDLLLFPSEDVACLLRSI